MPKQTRTHFHHSGTRAAHIKLTTPHSAHKHSDEANTAGAPAIYQHRRDACVAYIFGTTTTLRGTLWGRTIDGKARRSTAAARHTDTGLHYKMVAIVDLRVGSAMCSYDLADDVCRPCVCHVGRHATLFSFVVFRFFYLFIESSISIFVGRSVSHL